MPRVQFINILAFCIFARIHYGPINSETHGDSPIHVQGVGKVFLPDPLTSSGAKYGDAGYTDNNDQNSAQLSSQLVSVVLDSISYDPVTGKYRLAGPWCEITDYPDSAFCAPHNPDEQEGYEQYDPDFSSDRSDPRFEAVMAYYFITENQKYIHSLGFNNLRNGPMKVDVHTLPVDVYMEPNVTLKKMLKRGRDAERFDEEKAVTITVFVFDVKPGEVETCNCHAKDQKYRDTHIELILKAGDDEKIRRVIVEVTPRIRAMMKEKGIDWSTKALRDSFKWKTVRVTGWLFFDQVHADESENTTPARQKNWRATAWEVHPVTNIQILE